MKTPLRHFSAPACALALILAVPAYALTINPTFDSSITTDPNALVIEAGINAAIARVTADIANNVTVNILFQEGGGLGSSSTYISTQAYSTYVAELGANQTRSVNDNIAITSLPASLAAVNGNAASTVTLALPLLRALGVNVNPPTGQPDSTITLNTSLMNLSRTGTQNSNKYDLQAVAAHEIDEVLSIGGSGSQLGQANSGSSVGALDLFRFSSSGIRSYTTSTSAASYFSINSGVTRFVSFNQAGNGSDYADWGDGVSPADSIGNKPPQVQDAFGTPGAQLDLGPNELAALDVVGWNLTAAGLAGEAQVVPEPGTAALSALGLLAASLATLRQRKRASQGHALH